MEKDGESEAGSTKNLMRNMQAMASAIRPCENTSTGMFSIRSRASTAPATHDTEDSLRRENIEHDKGLHDKRKEIDMFKRDMQRTVNFQGEEVKELKKTLNFLKL